MSDTKLALIGVAVLVVLIGCVVLLANWITWDEVENLKYDRRENTF